MMAKSKVGKALSAQRKMELDFESGGGGKENPSRGKPPKCSHCGKKHWGQCAQISGKKRAQAKRAHELRRGEPLT
jgi:hypothetical protein